MAGEVDKLAEIRQRLSQLREKASQVPATPYSVYDTIQEEAYAVLHKKATYEGLVQDQKERKKYAQLIYWMIVGWLIIILTLIFLYGFKIVDFSDAVLITLITTTTANITVFFLGVVRYLFPNKLRSN